MASQVRHCTAEKGVSAHLCVQTEQASVLDEGEVRARVCQAGGGSFAGLHPA